MKSTNPLCLLLTAVALMLVSCVADESDLIVGSWKVVKSEIHGSHFSPSIGDVFNFHTGGNYSVIEADGSKSYGVWEYRNENGRSLSLYTDDGDANYAVYEIQTLTSQTLVLGFDFGLMYGTYTLERLLDGNSRDR